MRELGTSRRAFLRAGAAMSVAAIGALGFAKVAAANVLDALGIKKLLGNASDGALTKLAVPDGFYRDAAIRIVLPGSTGKLARTVLKTGDKLGLTSKLSKSLNDAASLAANEAKPIFRSAIDGLKLSDVPDLAVKKQGGTEYLQRTASDDLTAKITPLISSALTQVGAYDQMAKLGKSTAIVRVLGLSNEKLTSSVSQQAMKGIFNYMGREEENLRANPGKILGKIF